MKVKLVFLDWRDKNGNSIYNSVDGTMLSGTVFHSGSTFDADVSLKPEDAEFLKKVLAAGDHVPVFYVKQIFKNE